jgi:hypothetical protein
MAPYFDQVTKFAEVPEYKEGPNSGSRARKTYLGDCRPVFHHHFANIV